MFGGALLLLPLVVSWLLLEAFVFVDRAGVFSDE